MPYGDLEALHVLRKNLLINSCRAGLAEQVCATESWQAGIAFGKQVLQYGNVLVAFL